ncbi:3-oxoacyl-ACP synthase III family protein [Micromonospora endolithica]|uniref:Ketoacyl-ACP synthase III n=1 Tax=Micromonospora endolithica TaxID=230091 RepID=A0A3A9ZPV5_9ACTN|nr:ketoacyl-ACP synthase III [Micromonospora endolithica]RKN50262.1 ketoacyl-ACP synthase III [Micromonospora endolithica]TWJ21091.1 3-oxoacyl-[acyl-carrier-protein] synthase-3 [Micromonospora endolithica]
MTASPPTVGVLSCGSYVPDREVSNAEIGPAAGVTAEWIETKTGIRARRWAHPGQAASDLAWAAAKETLDRAGVDPEQLTVIVVATSTPDSPQPPTACIVQDRLGARNAYAFDLNAVCTGFLYAVEVARRISAGGLALVIAVDIYSRILDPADRRTVALFGDGAGAVLLGPAPPGRGIEAIRLASFGEHHDLIGVPGGGSRMPLDERALAAGEQFFKMRGRAVREFIELQLPPAIKRFLTDHDVDDGEIRHFVPHQANGHLVAGLSDRLALPSARTHATVQTLGNTGCASVPVTLAAGRDQLAPGDLILLAAFGGGMTVGLALLRW